MGFLTKITTGINKYIYWRHLALLLCIIFGLILIATFFENIMIFVGDIIKNYNHFAWWTIVITAGIGATHALLKRTKEDNTFFLRFINNPFLGAIFTSVTYGITINACLTLLYIVLYDNRLMLDYPHLDKVTTGIALVLLFTGSLSGLLKMIWEICKIPETKVSISPQKIDNED